MATFDDFYARLVTWLKFGLPLAALAILSTLFLFARTNAPSVPTKIPGEATERSAAEPTISEPSFSGVTTDGTAYRVGARTARIAADNSRQFSATELSAFLQTPDNTRIDIAAPLGTYDVEARIAQLRQGVSLQTSDGYTIETEVLIANLKENSLATTGPVAAEGPLGKIEAGLMLFQQQSSDASTPIYELIFKDGVKLVYRPQD